MAVLAIACFLMAAPARASQPAPAAQEFVDPAALKARADALRDAVADMNVSDVAVKGRAHGFFDKLPEERLVLPVVYRRMDRELVTGKLGSIAGMQEAADKRIAEWGRTHKEPPPPDLMTAVAQARALQDGRSLSYDDAGQLAPNQMGIFQYMRGSFDGGLIKLNERLKIIGALIGDAFTYATVVHEAQHALDHAAGRLTPEQTIAGEISSFYAQYLMIKLTDPSGERMLTSHASLNIRMRRERDPAIKAAINEAIIYLEHLSDVVATNGKEDELKKLIEKLGYKDGKHDHHGGGHKGRGGALPTSA